MEYIEGRNYGGARRDRTADLLHAMQALSQLSYGPTREGGEGTEGARRCQDIKAADAKPFTPSALSRVVHPAEALRRAASRRASVRSRPSSSSVASIGGETAVPVTATRTG